MSLPGGRARWLAWYPLLFAAYPILFLWSQNLGETNAADVLPLLVMSVGITAVVLAVLTLIFRDGRRAALVVAPLVIGLLMYGHLWNLLHPLGVRNIIQQAGWVALAALGLFAAIRLGESRLTRITRILDGVAAVLVLVTLVMIVPAQIASATEASPQPEAGPVTATGAPTRPLRDVYYLVLDRYGSDRAIDLRFGVKNDLTPWLAEHGFKVLSDSHANYVKTSLSMASTLSMSQLTDLAAKMGPDSPDHAPVFAMLQDSRVVQQFKALGYQYLHIGSYFAATRTDTAADHNYYLGGPSDFGAALYDASAAPALLKRLRITRGTDPVFERHHQTGIFDFKALNSVRDAKGPKFVFGHFLLPHPPYSFRADGTFRDAPEAKSIPEPKLFAEQLAWTNGQLKSWLESVLALPADQQPIIILQADEGPYTIPYNTNTVSYDWSTATPEELQIKYGILNAWYVPGGTDIGLTDSQTSVNTFPTLFSGYFGLNVPKLPDREYTSAGKNRPYDLTDITDRLDSWKP